MAAEGKLEVSLEAWLSRIEDAITSQGKELRDKLDALNDRLDSKADRRDVHDLKTNVAELRLKYHQLEVQTVKREGPIVTELKAFEERVESLEAAQSARSMIRSFVNHAVSVLGGAAAAAAILYGALNFLH